MAVISTDPSGMLSFILTAASTAWRSSGLSSASTPSLTIVPVFSSILTLSTAGTCFTSTAIRKLIPPAMHFGRLSETADKYKAIRYYKLSKIFFQIFHIKVTIDLSVF